MVPSQHCLRFENKPGVNYAKEGASFVSHVRRDACRFKSIVREEKDRKQKQAQNKKQDPSPVKVMSHSSEVLSAVSPWPQHLVAVHEADLNGNAENIEDRHPQPNPLEF